MFKISIHDRKYEKYEISSFLKEDIIPDIDPIINKLFHDDIFALNECKEPHILKSSVRETPFFAGVLVLSGNKTYGRKNSSKKNINFPKIWQSPFGPKQAKNSPKWAKCGCLVGV